MSSSYRPSHSLTLNPGTRPPPRQLQPQRHEQETPASMPGLLSCRETTASPPPGTPDRTSGLGYRRCSLPGSRTAFLWRVGADSVGLLHVSVWHRIPLQVSDCNVSPGGQGRADVLMDLGPGV
ncbi:hypothetical protein GHT09_015761 [Marmota monax]|uniref:Uncharacterized protein n=1 Tax=Marmota monax TaxID=9995 RepID=A0A834Q7I1_MARMO|nr:hypothetical protein GHT09_015761 [Marmota monax]